MIEDAIIVDGTSTGKGTHPRRVIAERLSIIPATRQLGLDLARTAAHVDRAEAVRASTGPFGPLRAAGRA